MWTGSRRRFLTILGAAAGGACQAALWRSAPARAQHSAAAQSAPEILNPRLRVPLSFLVDDSTCLVNMGRFCMPQFAAAWPNRADYQKPWQSWPAEIPDAFVRTFGQWCGEHGVKGKFSIVPNPACVGWLDRELPGWSRQQLQASLQLVRDLMLPNWDIHPEMITHTRVIDLRTGRPLPEISPAAMENWYPPADQSVDELAAYIAYALRILRNCELPCEGITTPGGFGGGVEQKLSLAVQQAVQDVFGAEIPHYFKFVAEGDESTAPRLEHVRQSHDRTQLTVSIFAGTGDWFGDWDGDGRPQPDRYCRQDGTQGRLVELIERGEPAILLCHWPGMYTQGTGQGFAALQQVVGALEAHYRDVTLWMKPSEIARYWAARQLTTIVTQAGHYVLQAPFACPLFTLRVPHHGTQTPVVTSGTQRTELRAVSQPAHLAAGTWLPEPAQAVLCFDLAQGETTIEI